MYLHDLIFGCNYNKACLSIGSWASILSEAENLLYCTLFWPWLTRPTRPQICVTADLEGDVQYFQLI